MNKKIKSTVVFTFFILALMFFSCGQNKQTKQPTDSPVSKAQQRISQFGRGMNLSWMENWWEGSEENDFTDYLDLSQLPERKKDLQLIKQLGFSIVRLPVCFHLWYQKETPFKLIKPEYYTAIDSILYWAGQTGLKIIIDYHHGKLTEENAGSEIERICSIWAEIVERYKNFSSEKVFFEIYNEPVNITPETWRDCAIKMVTTIRSKDTNRTIIVGAEDWNGYQALMNFQPLSDDNIIYTFHYYDPFLFTHQGGSWVGDPVSTTGIDFPYNPATMPELNPKAKGTFAEASYQSYAQDGTSESIEKTLTQIKEWADSNDIPIFCGEWGSYKKFANIQSRCYHAEAVLNCMEKLQIANAFWEWNAGFSFFDGPPVIENIYPCMKTVWKF